MQHDPRAATTPVPDVSIVVPVYNSAATLASLIQRLTMVLDQEPETYEIVLVDDGSADDSWPVLQRLRAQSGSNLVTIQLMRNYGQHNALMCGLRHAQGRVVVTMDDDLQNPPEEIPKLLRHLQASNADLVYGAPEDRNHAPWRNLGAALVLHFYRLVFKTPITPTPFRAMRRELVDSVKFYDLNYTFLDGLLAWCTRRVENVTVEHHPRAQGRSGYSISRLLTMALNLYTNFSLLPLQLVSVLGLERLTKPCHRQAPDRRLPMHGSKQEQRDQRRTVQEGCATIAGSCCLSQRRPPAGKRRDGAERHRVCSAYRHPVGRTAPGVGLWQRYDLLAAAA